jgi:hypothetical protein
MRKSLKKKLSLNRETLRALEDRSLQEAVGGVKTHTCGDPCTTTCAPPTA